MSSNDTSLPQLPASYDAAFKELEELAAKATQGEISIDELSAAIRRGNQLHTYLADGIAKIKAEIEEHAPGTPSQPDPA